VVQVLAATLLREALAHAEAAVTVFTADRQLLAVNDRYLELTGFGRDEIEEHRAGETLHLHPFGEAEFLELLTAAISAGEADIILKSGEPLAVEYVFIPTSIDGEPHYIGLMWPLVGPEPTSLDG
jgi:PAS domain-containing protein